MASIKGFHVTFIACVLCLVSDRFLFPRLASAQHSHDGASETNQQLEGHFEFEVVSLHPHKPGTPFLDPELTPDSYRSSMRLSDMIMIAYKPQYGVYWSRSQIHGIPAWASDIYDIKARVAHEDMSRWQRSLLDEGSLEIADLERSALRAILKDRFKLMLSVTSIQVPYLDLTVSKQGPKLSAFVPGAVKPVGLKTSKLGKGLYITDLGERRFVGVTMNELAVLLTRLNSTRPIQDKTGLEGRYDFTVPLYDDQHLDDSNLDTPLARMPIARIGLVLKPGKGPAFLFNINHIKIPDTN